jgi:hypothetical protein
MVLFLSLFSLALSYGRPENNIPSSDSKIKNAEALKWLPPTEQKNIFIAYDKMKFQKNWENKNYSFDAIYQEACRYQKDKNFQAAADLLIRAVNRSHPVITLFIRITQILNDSWIAGTSPAMTF